MIDRERLAARIAQDKRLLDKLSKESPPLRVRDLCPNGEEVWCGAPGCHLMPNCRKVQR